MKKKILLIGRTGFVGSELYEFFKKNKISINYFSRKNISQSSKKLKKKFFEKCNKEK
jgi:NAD dependent epimerase/dehydratase family enzyme